MKFHHALTHIPLALAAFALTSPQAWVMKVVDREESRKTAQNQSEAPARA